jgi:Tfp pilus assembly protein PilF
LEGAPGKKVSFWQRKITLLVLVWAIILLLWFGVRKAVLGSVFKWYFVDGGTISFSFFPNVIIYMQKVLLPSNLTVVPYLKDMSFFYGIIVAMALAVGIIFSKQKRSAMVWFGLSWYIVFLLPSCLGAEVVHEYRIYIPFLGIILLLLETDLVKKLFTMGSKGLVFGMVIIISLAMTTFYYSDSFKDRFIYWKKAVKDSPRLPLAHANLGAMYYLDGEMEPAAYEYYKALYLSPEQKMIHSNLGLIFLRQGRWAEAEAEFLMEITDNPRYADAYYNLALLRYRQSRPQEARQLVLKALEIDPDLVEGYQILADDHYKEGDQKEAERYFNEIEKRKASRFQESLQKKFPDGI